MQSTTCSRLNDIRRPVQQLALLLVVGFLIAFGVSDFSSSFVNATSSSPFFGIHVVDISTGEGVPLVQTAATARFASSQACLVQTGIPLVQLKSTNFILYYTDSQGPLFLPSHVLNLRAIFAIFVHISFKF